MNNEENYIMRDSPAITDTPACKDIDDCKDCPAIGDCQYYANEDLIDV